MKRSQHDVNRIYRGAENVSELKKPKRKKKAPKDLTLNLSGVKFEDALRAALNTPPAKSGRVRKSELSKHTT